MGSTDRPQTGDIADSTVCKVSADHDDPIPEDPLPTPAPLFLALSQREAMDTLDNVPVESKIGTADLCISGAGFSRNPNGQTVAATSSCCVEQSSCIGVR